MSAISLATAQAQLQRYLDAETAVLTGQEYEIGGRRLKRADLTSIREGIKHWSAEVESLTQEQGGRGRVIAVRPGW